MRIQTIERTIGPFDVVEVPGEPEAPTVVFFHGYGADCYDLVSLADVIQAPPGTRWFFPNGPLEVDIGGGFQGRAWYPLDMYQFQLAMAKGIHKDLSAQQPENFLQRRDEGFEFLRSIDAKWDRLILGGFSQGSMLATDLAMHATESAAGLVILSGNLVAEADVRLAASKRSGMRFYQSHGRSDPILGIDGAKKLEKVLLSSGLRGQLHPFDGGHEIPPDVISAVTKFIQKSLLLTKQPTNR